MTRRTRALLFVLVLAWIAWAGLRPFEFLPPNRVSRIAGGPGLRFEAGGLALTRDELVWDTASGPARFALEVELRAGPAPADAEVAHDFLVLADDLRTPALVLYQQGADLVVADRVTNPRGERWYNHLWDGLYRLHPALLGGCRGVTAAPYLERAGFLEVRRTFVSQWTFPSEVVSGSKAPPGPDGRAGMEQSVRPS